MSKKQEEELSSLIGEDEKAEKKSDSMKALKDAYKANKAHDKNGGAIIWARLLDNQGKKKVALLLVYSLNHISQGRYIIDGYIIDGASKDNPEYFLAFNDLLPSDATEKMYFLEAYQVLSLNADREKLYKKARFGKTVKKLFVAEYKFAFESWPELFELVKKEDSK